MKTSNRILLIFFINIFLIPICLFMCLSSQIRKGEYRRVENRMHSERYKSGTLRPAHTVKLMATEREVICNVEYGDSVYYGYENYLEDDSLSVYVKGDTIYIDFAGVVPEEILLQKPIPLQVDLRLPSVSNFIVENGRVNILSMDTTKPQAITAEVNGGGVFNIGGPAIMSGEGYKKEEKVKQPLRLDQLSFNANNGKLELGENVTVRSLQLQVIGKSNLQFDNGAKVNEINGSFSDSTNVTGNWDLIKKINK